MADDPVVEAIRDLTRVTIALHGDFGSQAEAIRKLDALAIPPQRIAAILAIRVNAVHTALSRARKSVPAERSNDE